MTSKVALREQFGGFLAETLGLNFPPDRWRDLERALAPAARDLGFESVDGYAQWLLTASLTQTEKDALAARLTVGETYFYREPRTFDALREHVIPGIVQARRSGTRSLRVWSAGCCTGEEAYSLAIFFRRFFPELGDWHVSILGTDLNPNFLRKARAGIYRAWSFRSAPPWLQSDYFTQISADEFELDPAIRAMVEFGQLNLAEDSYPSLHNRTNGVDLIFCRNVLMYFPPAPLRRTVDALSRALIDGGYLAVGVCEVSSNLCPRLRANAFPEATLYQKPKPGMATAGRPEVPRRLDASLAFQPIAATARSEPSDPGHVAHMDRPAFLRRATDSFRNGAYDDAIDALETLLADGFDVDGAILLARVQANRGDLATALRWIERALVMDKLRPELHFLQGTILQEQGKAQIAAEAFAKALYLDPDQVLAHLALAELAERAGRSDQAARHRAQALRWLRRQPPDRVIDETEGLVAGRLVALVNSMNAENT